MKKKKKIQKNDDLSGYCLQRTTNFEENPLNSLEIHRIQQKPPENTSICIEFNKNLPKIQKKNKFTEIPFEITENMPNPRNLRPVIRLRKYDEFNKIILYIPATKFYRNQLH